MTVYDMFKFQVGATFEVLFQVFIFEYWKRYLNIVKSIVFNDPVVTEILAADQNIL